MTTAEELFLAMEEESTENRYAIIDNDLRTITIPDSIPYLGVMSDDSVLKLPFKMPATYCGFDLSEFTVYINYVNASNVGDRYRTNDVTKLDDGHLTFSWIVGRNAVSKVGNVKFVVCMRKYDDDNTTVIQEFNTTICTMPVLPGLETDEQVILPYTDLVNELVTKWQGEIDTAVNRANAIPTYIPSVSTNGIISWRNDKGAVNPASVDIKGPQGEKGDPGVGTIADIQTGSLIHMENACPESEIVELTIYGKSEQASTTGKNLLEMVDGSTDQYGVSCSISDGVISLSGTSAIESAFGVMFLETNIATILVPGETYTVSINGKFDSSYFQCNQIKDGYETVLFSIGPALVTSKSTFTVDEDTQIKQVFIGIIPGKPTVNDKFSVQIELGSTATSYEPYTGGKPSPSPEYPQAIESVGELSVVSTGKNLLDQSVLLEADGASFDGTWYSASLISLHRKFVDGIWKNTHGQAGPFTLSLKCFNSSGNDDSLGMIIYFLYENGTSTEAIRFRNSQTSEREYTATSDGSKVLSKIGISYSTGDRYIYKIKDFQIEAGSAATEYEPFGSTTPNLLVSEDGTAYELRSLPDGTRDELNMINRRKVLRKRILEKTFTYFDVVSLPTDTRPFYEAILYNIKTTQGLYVTNALPISNYALHEYDASTSENCFIVGSNEDTIYWRIPTSMAEKLGITTKATLNAWLVDNPLKACLKLATEELIDLGPADPIVLPEQISNVWPVSDPATTMKAEWFTTDGKQVWNLYSQFYANMTYDEISSAVAEGIPQGLGELTDQDIINAVIGGLSNG